MVDRTLPHTAQMVKRGTFADAPACPGPALAAQMNLLCTGPTVIDYALAGRHHSDLQFSASYAGYVKRVDGPGTTDYFCFVNRAAGTPLADHDREAAGRAGGPSGLSTRSADAVQHLVGAEREARGSRPHR